MLISDFRYSFVSFNVLLHQDHFNFYEYFFISIGFSSSFTLYFIINGFSYLACGYGFAHYLGSQYFADLDFF